MSSESFLKKIGVPASLAAIVSAAVTISIFTFKVDSRYAKADQVSISIDKVSTAAQKTNDKIDALASEVDRLSGVTQVLILVMNRSEAVPASKSISRVVEEELVPPPPSPMMLPPPDAPTADAWSEAPDFYESGVLEEGPIVEEAYDSISIEQALEESQEAVRTARENIRAIREEIP